MFTSLQKLVSLSERREQRCMALALPTETAQRVCQIRPAGFCYHVQDKAAGIPARLESE